MPFRSHALLTLATVFGLSLFGCKDVEKKSDATESASFQGSQGVIVYEISYPALEQEGNFILAALPKRMTLTFRGDLYKTEVVNKGLRFGTTLISNSTDKELTTVYQNGKKLYYTEMNESEVDEFLEEFPKVDYLPSDDVDSAFGVQCLHSVAIFNDISKEVDLAYTQDLKIPNPNWCNPYKQVDGMLLEYEIKYYGVQMSFKALEVNQDTVIEESAFSIPEDFEKVPYDVIRSELLELFKMVNGV